MVRHFRQVATAIGLTSRCTADRHHGVDRGEGNRGARGAAEGGQRVLQPAGQTDGSGSGPERDLRGTAGWNVPGCASVTRIFEINSPYNTYRNSGMPPGPIANPRKSALEAALRPAQTDYLYFVSDANGHHRFARTLEEHNQNINAYRRALRAQQGSASGRLVGTCGTVFRQLLVYFSVSPASKDLPNCMVRVSPIRRALLARASVACKRAAYSTRERSSGRSARRHCKTATQEQLIDEGQ